MVSQPEAPDYRIREAAEADLPALKRALAWAIEWRSPALSASPEHVISSTGHEYILAGWGREGDTAVVAQCASEPIGAAWYRFWNPELHSYGYIDSSTPEIGIAVEPRWRRRGVG
jgi:GNAT superfamily N-acetyltransferase